MGRVTKLGKRFLINYWPIILLTFLALLFFYKFFLRGLVPMPADLIVGAYYPWLDYKWSGYNAGVPVKNPLISDVPSVLYPARYLAFEIIKTAELPLWNTTMFNGYPLLATFQTAVLYPLNLIYFFTSFIIGWSIEVIMQLVLAAVFTYLFLRNLALNKLAAIFGSIAYAFCGFNIIWLEYNVHTHVAAFIPLFLLLTNKFIQTKNHLYLVILSFSIAIQLFAGYPQLTLYTLLFIFLWTIYQLEIWKYWRQKISSLILISLFFILGILLSSVQLFPGLELYQLSQRTVETVVEEYRFLPLEKLVTIFAPDYFGNVSTYNYWSDGDYTQSVVYTGIITIILACFSIFLIKSKREVKFFWFIILGTLLLITYNPVGTFIIQNFHDNILKGSKAAALTRSLVFFNLALAVLAAYGFHYFLQERLVPKKIIRALYFPVIIILGITFGTLLVKYYLDNLPTSYLDYNHTTEVFNATMSKVNIALRNLILPNALTLATLLAIAATLFKKRFKLPAAFFLIFLLTFELFRFGWKITPFSEQSFVYPTTPVIDYLAKIEKPFRIAEGDVIPQNMWVPYKIEANDGYDAVYPFNTSDLIGAINAQRANAHPQGRYGNITNYNNRYMDLTNARFVLATKFNGISMPDPEGIPKVDKFPETKFTKAFDDKSVAILENKDYLERAFVVTYWETIPDPETAKQKILFDKNFILKRQIILNSDFNDFQQTDENSSKVEYLSYKNNESTIKVNSQNDALLFISDTYYPGWKAEIDGQPTKILQANYAFRAIPVGAGEHIVKMYYEPNSIKLGLLISSLAFLFLISYGILVKTKGRKI